LDAGAIMGKANKDRYMVFWKARVLTADRQLHKAIIKEVMQGGFSIDFPHTVPLGTEINIEFYVDFRDKRERVRAKTEVVYCLLRSNSESAKLDLKITRTSKEEMHLLNNILMTFSESKEIDLKL
jgi:hypothetical protein